MKASPTVIYDIGMSGMVTRPMGRAEFQRYLDVDMDEETRGLGGGGYITHLQESVLPGYS